MENRLGVSNPRSAPSLPYLSALVLPVLASLLTARVIWLHPVPYALHFVLVGIIAVGGRVGPSLVAALVSIVSHHLFLTMLRNYGALGVSETTRSSLLVLLALIVSLVSKSRRRSADDLETALDVLQDRTDALVDSLHASKCAAWVFDFDKDRTLRWYPGSYQIFGIPFSEVEQQPTLRSLVHPDDQLRLPALAKAMRTSWEPVSFECRAPWPDGSLHTLEMRGTRSTAHRCLWRGVTVDITERRAAEAALLRSEKLAAMGRLASTVAHEINNPLEAATNLLYLARADSTLSETTGDYLLTAERELARLGNITRLTLGFVRSGASSTHLDVANVVEDVLSIFRHRYESRGIVIERHYQPGILITIASHELRQILTNLIANSIDAALGLHPPETETAAQETLAGPRIAIRISCEEETAALLIEDNGSGIAPIHLARIFEPFFTTKPDIGTGIGLWVTRDLVEKNGGRISVESAPFPDGMRTRFRLTFPTATIP